MKVKKNAKEQSGCESQPIKDTTPLGGVLQRAHEEVDPTKPRYRRTTRLTEIMAVRVEETVGEEVGVHSGSV